MSTDVGFKTFLKSNLTQQMLLARQASFDDNMLAQQVAPLAPGYRTALSLRSQMLTVAVRGVFSNSPDCRKGLICWLAYCVDMRLETQVVIKCNTKVSNLLQM